MRSNSSVIRKLGTLLFCVCVAISTGVVAKGVVRTPGGEGEGGGKAGGGGPSKPDTPGKDFDNPKPAPSKPSPIPADKSVVSKIKDYFSGAVSDAEHVGAGRFDRVGENTKSDLANMLKDQFNGNTKTPDFDIGNNVVVWGEKRPDGSVVVGFRKNY